MVSNPLPEELIDKPTLYAVEIYGSFYFWPSWSAASDGKFSDFSEMTYDAGISINDVIPPMIWPELSGPLPPVNFYGGLLNRAMNALLCDVARWECEMILTCPASPKSSTRPMLDGLDQEDDRASRDRPRQSG